MSEFSENTERLLNQIAEEFRLGRETMDLGERIVMLLRSETMYEEIQEPLIEGPYGWGGIYKVHAPNDFFMYLWREASGKLEIGFSPSHGYSGALVEVSLEMVKKPGEKPSVDTAVNISLERSMTIHSPEPDVLPRTVTSTIRNMKIPSPELDVFLTAMGFLINLDTELKEMDIAR